jgi:hypothetical protein
VIITTMPKICAPISSWMRLTSRSRRWRTKSVVELKPLMIAWMPAMGRTGGGAARGSRPRAATRSRPRRAEHPAAHDLQAPRRLQERRLLAARTLDDARADPEVREHAQALHERRDERHEAEGVGLEEPRERQIREEAEELTDAASGQRRERARNGSRKQRRLTDLL